MRWLFEHADFNKRMSNNNKKGKGKGSSITGHEGPAGE
jgi:hypothetical protein